MNVKKAKALRRTLFEGKDYHKERRYIVLPTKEGDGESSVTCVLLPASVHALYRWAKRHLKP